MLERNGRSPMSILSEGLHPFKDVLHKCLHLTNRIYHLNICQNRSK